MSLRKLALALMLPLFLMAGTLWGSGLGNAEQATAIDLSQIKAGDFVCFGHYPQSSLGTDAPPAGIENTDWVAAEDVRNKNVLTYYAIEPIVWRVLENSGGELLLLSQSILDCKPYNDTLPSVAWKDCTIRKWLNDRENDESFISRAFDVGERAAMRLSNNEVDDLLFFLSFDEADRYFADDEDRIAYNSAYSASVHSLHADYWWIRTPPGGLAGYAAYISDFGKAYSGGHHVFYIVGVRPAFRLNLSLAAFVSGDGSPADPYAARTENTL